MPLASWWRVLLTFTFRLWTVPIFISLSATSVLTMTMRALISQQHDVSIFHTTGSLSALPSRVSLVGLKVRLLRCDCSCHSSERGQSRLVLTWLGDAGCLIDRWGQWTAEFMDDAVKWGIHPGRGQVTTDNNFALSFVRHKSWPGTHYTLLFQIPDSPPSEYNILYSLHGYYPRSVLSNLCTIHPPIAKYPGQALICRMVLFVFYS